MNRAYYNWFSTSLNRNMELLAFGDRGAKVIFFPTRKAHFYDYENWGVIQAMQPLIEKGHLHVFCVDSVDADSFYNQSLSPAERILKHELFEKYIIDELLPFMHRQNSSVVTFLAGCSLGAFHAMNIALRHPQFFSKVVGMSGRYDLTQAMGSFQDLFNGFIDENIGNNMPNKYMSVLHDQARIEAIKKLKIILAIGAEDAFLADNQFLSRTFSEKGIQHELWVWTGESHNPEQWKQMVQLYL